MYKPSKVYTIKTTSTDNPFIQLFIKWYPADRDYTKEPVADTVAYTIKSTVEIVEQESKYSLLFRCTAPDGCAYSKSIYIEEPNGRYINFTVVQGGAHVPLYTSSGIAEVFTVSDTFKLADGNYIVINSCGVYAVIDIGKLIKYAKTISITDIWDFNIVYPGSTKLLTTTIIAKKYNKDEESDTKEPNIEEPGIEEPDKEEPSIEELNIEELNIEEPSIEESDTEEPDKEEYINFVYTPDIKLHASNGLTVTNTSSELHLEKELVFAIEQANKSYITYINGIPAKTGNIQVVFNTVPPTIDDLTIIDPPENTEVFMPTYITNTNTKE